MEHSPGHSGTVDKALDLLLHLHAADSARGLTEIARALELPKSTAHRLPQPGGGLAFVKGTPAPEGLGLL